MKVEKYRLKPRIVKAIKLWSYNVTAIKKLIGERTTSETYCGKDLIRMEGKDGYGGRFIANPGDYIIIDGEKISCMKENDFKEQYEKVLTLSPLLK